MGRTTIWLYSKYNLTFDSIGRTTIWLYSKYNFWLRLSW